MAVDGGGGAFRPVDLKSVAEYIKATPALFSRLGSQQLYGLTINEVGDGNLNFVYIVAGPTGSFVIKQALPYIRCIGESWPMTKERAYFETRTLQEHGRLCPNNVPEVYHFDRSLSLIGMQYLKPPHIILRKGLIAGTEYPLLAEHMSEYMARTLFFTSLLYHSTSEHRHAAEATAAASYYRIGLLKVGLDLLSNGQLPFQRSVWGQSLYVEILRFACFFTPACSLVQLYREFN